MGKRSRPTLFSRSAVSAARLPNVDGDLKENPDAARPVLSFLPADPEDPRLTLDGLLLRPDGRVDVDAYQDLQSHFVGEPPPDRHPDPEHPGVRQGEVVAKGLQIWDDLRVQSSDAPDAPGAAKKDGAGWIVTFHSKSIGKRTKWFNIRTCGSWRMAFLLASLQRRAWVKHGVATKKGSTVVQDEEEEGEEDGRPGRKKRKDLDLSSQENPAMRPRYRITGKCSDANVTLVPAIVPPIAVLVATQTAEQANAQEKLSELQEHASMAKTPPIVETPPRPKKRRRLALGLASPVSARKLPSSVPRARRLRPRPTQRKVARTPKVAPPSAKDGAGLLATSVRVQEILAARAAAAQEHRSAELNVSNAATVAVEVPQPSVET